VITSRPESHPPDRAHTAHDEPTATAGLQVVCLRLACDWRDIDEREPALVPEYLPQLIAQTGKPLLFVRPSTPDSAFQACIDQFEIKDGNRLRNSGSLVRSQPGSPTQSEKSRACSERTMPGPSRRLLCPSDARDRRGKPIRPNRSDRLSVAKVGWSNNEAGDVLFDGRAFLS
jgi:hypothetical protein